MPKVKVRLFASYREAAGRASLEVDLPAGATAAELRTALAGQVPALGRLLSNCVVAVNGEFASDSARLGGGDEVAVFPPVAGG